MPNYYGKYSRIVYNCVNCGARTWADRAVAYLDKELTRVSGGANRQRRGYRDMCQECADGPLRLVKALRSLGYTNVDTDDWEALREGSYTVVVLFDEPIQSEAE